MDASVIPWRATRYPGTSIHFYSSDRRTGRTVALIRMDPGCGYPRHRHQGTEEVLVMQGSYRDEFGEHPEGSFVTYEDGSMHSPVATEGGTCILLAVAHEGIALAP